MISSGEVAVLENGACAGVVPVSTHSHPGGTLTLSGTGRGTARGCFPAASMRVGGGGEAEHRQPHVTDLCPGMELAHFS